MNDRIKNEITKEKKKTLKQTEINNLEQKIKDEVNKKYGDDGNDNFNNTIGSSLNTLSIQGCTCQYVTVLLSMYLCYLNH